VRHRGLGGTLVRVPGGWIFLEDHDRIGVQGG
jgi:hypothetical protein